jgi:hypothetical protein
VTIFRTLGKSEVRGQKTEDGGRKTEVGGQKAEIRDQRTEDRGQRTEVRRQMTEDTPVEFPWGNPIQLGKEDGRRRTEVGGQK